MLKTAALALVVLVAGSFGASSAMAGVGLHAPARLLGKIERQTKVKKFVKKIGKIHGSAGKGGVRPMRPSGLPRK
jgi:hypothetical protein